MAIYKSFNRLNGKTLKFEDTVVFGPDLIYEVREGFLYNTGTGENTAVFKKLGADKQTLAVEAYGYVPGTGYWPDSNMQDYEALTRLCLVLFGFLEGAEEVILDMPDNETVAIKNETVAIKITPAIEVGMIGDYNTFVNRNYIIVGCTLVPFKKVEEVYKKMCELRKD